MATYDLWFLRKQPAVMWKSQPGLASQPGFTWRFQSRLVPQPGFTWRNSINQSGIPTLLGGPTRVSRRVTRQEGLTWVGSCGDVNTYCRLTVEELTLWAGLKPTRARVKGGPRQGLRALWVRILVWCLQLQVQPRLRTVKITSYFYFQNALLY